jgi:hypothetical protein
MGTSVVAAGFVGVGNVAFGLAGEVFGMGNRDGFPPPLVLDDDADDDDAAEGDVFDEVVVGKEVTLGGAPEGDAAEVNSDGGASVFTAMPPEIVGSRMLL